MDFYRFPPRYGPEWGSGGVFGMRFHRGVLYFTLAFEAEAHFKTREYERIYRFEQVGYQPTSGGDTYNAVDVVDEYIYFGGWVHAPARYAGRRGRSGTILFYDKYSHVHIYDTSSDEIRLLWKEGIGHESEWAGEVSEIVYDPVNDRLLVARADGHRNLGIYALDRRSGEAEKLSDKPGLKGSLFSDYAFFDVMESWHEGMRAIQCLDLVTGKWEFFNIDYEGSSPDGSGAAFTLPGPAVSAYGRFFHFVRGGVVAGNPLSGEPLSFYRLFDFAWSGYGPLRTVALPVGGGILTAFNAYTHGVLYPRNEEEEAFAKATQTILGPTVLVYITPPQAKIVGVLGARVTSLESMNGKILVGACTTANYGALDAGPVDAGWKDILVFSQDILFSSPPPAQFFVPGWMVGGFTWGGIPLLGYRDPKLIVSASKPNKLNIYEYEIAFPASEAEKDEVSIHEGKNIVDLSSHKSIVSFKLGEADQKLKAKIILT